MEKRLLSLAISLCMVLSLLPATALAVDLSATTQMSGADSAAPAPALPEELLPKGRTAARASEISIVGNSVYANGIPIVIKENDAITSVYAADGTTLLSGETDIKEKWIFGGVASGDYVGNTSITVKSGTLTKNLYGGNGGTNSNLTGNTSITIDGGEVNMIFGGNQNYGTITGDTNITINGGLVKGWVYGGSAIFEGGGPSNVNGDTHVALNGGTVSGNIYGGGSWRGATVTNSNVTITGGTVYAVFGGGENASTVTGTATVVVDGNPSIGSYVYGGGAGFDNTDAMVNSADVQIKSGTVSMVYGGGAGYDGVSNTTGDVSISVSGGTITDLAASDNARSKVTGDVSISLTGGTIHNSCHLAGYYEPANTIQDVTLMVGSDMNFGTHFSANLIEPISGNLNIDIDGTFIKMRLNDNVLPAEKEAKVTYRNIGSPNGTWTSYPGNPYPPVPGTNPQMSSPATSYGTPALGNNKLTEFALVNSYVDFKDNSLSNQAQDFAAFTDKLTLDGGALRCYFDMNSNFPLTVFQNNPLLYYGYAYKGPSSGTSTMNFADTIGTARVQLLNKSGDVEADPLGGQPIATNGIDCVVAPSDAPDNTFSLQNNAFSEGKQFWGKNTVNLGGGSEVMKIWQVRNATSCCCSLGRASLRTYTFYLEELSDGFTVADYLDGADASEFTQSCPIIEHRQGQFRYTYSIEPDGTTAAGESITGNQLTATGTGTVRVVVTAELNDRTSSDTLSVHVAERPTKKSYFFSIDSTADDYKDVVLTYKGETLRNNGVINETNSVPPALAWLTPEQCVWTFNASKSEATVTIKKEYLAALGETALKSYDFNIALGTGANGYINDKVTILVSDKEPALIALTADKMENIVYGNRVTYQAAVTKGNAACTPEPTGTVQFRIDGVDCGNPMPLATAQIILNHTALTVGKHVVSAAYSGDENYAVASSTMNVTVGKAALTVKPKDVEIKTGSALPTNEVEYIGLVGEDTPTVAELESGTLEMQLRNAADDGALTDTNTAGSYKIVFTGAPVFKAVDNYTFSTGDGVLTIVTPSNSGVTTVTPPKTETVTNPDGSTTTTTTDKATGTVTKTTKNPDGSAKQVITVETKRPDGSTVKSETAVTTDAKGKTTGAIGTVVSDSASGVMQVPAKVMETLTKTPNASLRIETPHTTLTLDGTAIKALAAKGGKAPEVRVSPATADELPQAAKEQLKDAAVFRFNVNGGGIDFGGGKVTVTLDYARKSGNTVIAVYYVDDKGGMTKMPGSTFKGGKVTFPVDHFSLYAIEEEAMPFTDVAVDSYYANAVLWAADEGVTSGTSADKFSPDAVSTRAQAVTFLWRAMGSPAPTGTSNPFTDVSADAYYYNAVLWAAEQGITGGTSADRFSPDAVCTRAQVATFLWRAAKSPVVSGDMLFTDVPSDAFYAQAVRWAVSEGVTSGTSETTFSPHDTCTRAQIVTFLYRSFAE